MLISVRKEVYVSERYFWKAISFSSTHMMSWQMAWHTTNRWGRWSNPMCLGFLDGLVQRAKGIRRRHSSLTHPGLYCVILKLERLAYFYLVLAEYRLRVVHLLSVWFSSDNLIQRLAYRMDIYQYKASIPSCSDEGCSSENYYLCLCNTEYLHLSLARTA